MSEVKVQVIYKNDQFVQACNSTQGVNCGQESNSARLAWLRKNRYYAGDDAQYEVIFKNPNDINAISGVWIEIYGKGMLIDAAATQGGATSVDAYINACNGCCGDNAVVASKYAGVYPAFQPPVAKTYTVVRTDDGSLLAQTTFSLDYISLISGSLSKTGYANGQSTYVFQAYSDPVAVGSDTLSETARVFTSNAAPALTGSNVFEVSGTKDAQAYDIKGANTLAGTVAILNADIVASTFGTWAVVGQTITLTTTKADYATIVIGQEAA